MRTTPQSCWNVITAEVEQQEGVAPNQPPGDRSTINVLHTHRLSDSERRNKQLNETANMPHDPQVACQRALRPRTQDKWQLLSQPTGTTNELQEVFVRPQVFMRYVRLHPRVREPSYSPVQLKGKREHQPDWLAAQRSQRTTIYSSWERCSRACSTKDLHDHLERCRGVRDALRHHPQVLAELNMFWTTVEESMTSLETVDGNSALKFDDYCTVQVRLSKALGARGGRSLTEKEAIRAAKHDWELDREPDSDNASFEFMRRRAFLDSIFKVADAWAPGTTPIEYATFLRALFMAITDPETGALQAVEKVSPITGVGEEDMMKAIRAQATHERLVPRPPSLYCKPTACWARSVDGVAEAKAERAATEAKQAKATERWAARLKALQAQHAASAASGELSSVPQGSFSHKEAARARPPHATRHPISGQRPVTHWQKCGHREDPSAWLHRAQEWLDRLSASAPSSPRAPTAARPTTPSLSWRRPTSARVGVSNHAAATKASSQSVMPPAAEAMSNSRAEGEAVPPPPPTPSPSPRLSPPQTRRAAVAPLPPLAGDMASPIVLFMTESPRHET